MTEEKKTRNAGRSTRQMANKRRTKAMIYLVLLIIAFSILVLIWTNSKNWGIGGLGLLGIILFFRILMDIFDARAERQIKEKDRAERGALAEEGIEDGLDALGEGFYVLHDIPNPYGNVDHIVLSEHHGIFLLETKSHRGKVQILDDRLLVNGKPPEKDFIGQVLGNTYWLKEKLTKISGTEVWIAPILVFTNAFVAPLNKRIKNVTITNKKYLESLLKETRSTAASARVWEMREQITKTLIADQGR